jgi:hypothetical protein
MSNAFDFGSTNIALALDVDFPSNVYAGPGIAISKTGAAWTVSLGYPPLSENSSPVPSSNYYLAVYNVAQTQYQKTRLDNLISAATGLDTRTPMGDADYIATPIDRYIGIATPLTLNRTLSLPPASSVPGGREISVQDEIGTLTASHYLVVRVTGTDTIDGKSQRILSTPYGGLRFRSNGSTAWNVVATTSLTPVNDTAYTCNMDDKVIAYTALTAARTVTLPLAANYPPGQRLTVMDQVGACTATITLTVLPQGGDLINGLSSSPVLTTAHAFLGFVSDGVSRWSIVDNVGGGGATTVTASQITDASPLGRLLITQTTAAQDRASLGSQPTGDAMFLAGTPTAGRAVLGSGTVGDQVFISSTTVAAGSALGLGSMAYQNSSSVSITGGTITGVAGLGGASITISDTPPGSPAAGSMWFDSVGGQLYVWYNDGTSSQWVPSSNQNLGGLYLPLTGGTVSGAVTINNTLTATGPSSLGAATVTSLNGGQLAGMRNKLINGDMRIDQRNLVTVGINTAVGSNYGFDRWTCLTTQAGKISYGKYAGGLANMPQGFVNSATLTTAAAFTPAATDYFLFAQYIEGLNVADLGWGAAGALPVMLSFWFLSNQTGPFSGAFANGAGSRSYPFSFAYPTINVWQKVSIAIPGDATGTWATDNSNGIALVFDLGNGSNYRGTGGAWTAGAIYGVTGATSIVRTVGANFVVTGVQLEAGTIATPFERRLVGAELSLCQRYYFDAASGGATAAYQVGCYSPVAATITTAMINLPVAMRANPTVALRNQSYGNATAVQVNIVSPATAVTSLTTNVSTNNANASFNAAFSAEL